jgi:hypothetical protein
MTALFHRHLRALTIVEILVAICVLALLGTGAIAGLLTINRMVTANRFATNAHAIAQSAIDRILTVPYSSSRPRPAELEPGFRTQTDVPIYVDPASGALVVSGLVETMVTNVSHPIVPGRPAPPLVFARVAVTYFAAGRNHTVALSTVRAPD